MVCGYVLTVEIDEYIRWLSRASESLVQYDHPSSLTRYGFPVRIRTVSRGFYA